MSRARWGSKCKRQRGVKAGGQAMQHRLVGYAVERDEDKRRRHVLVDVPSHGYMQSPFRVVGAEVELKVKHRMSGAVTPREEAAIK